MSTATGVLQNDHLPGDPKNKSNRFQGGSGQHDSNAGESTATNQETAVEGKRARAQQQVWKSHEVELLQQGVARYGRNWKAILDDNDFAPTLGGRSAGSLKLKWYKMSKEHEEKMNANSRLWGHHQSIPPGQSMTFMGIEGGLMGGLNNPFGKPFMDGYGGIGGSCEGMFDPFRPEEIQALKESTARYGPNWTAILSDPNYAVPLMNRSPAALQMFWNQLQEMPKPSLFDNGNHANNNQDDCNSEGLDGFSEGYQQSNQPLQSMRSWGRLETDALVKGFEIYGTDWKAILHDARYRPHLSHRTAHSLKSKWARMMKKRKRDDNRQFSMQSPSPMSMNGFGSDPNPSSNALLNSSDCFTTNHAFNIGIPAALNEGGLNSSSIQPALDPSENYDRSIDEYTREIALNLSNPVLYNHRGVVYYAKGLIDQALDDFTTAIALDCSYADAFTNRGMAFNSKGEFDLAIMDCTTTIDINPTSNSAMNAYLTRALTHYNKGMYAECIADCEATLALKPRCVSALVTRGLTIMAQAKEGNKISAEMIRHYEMALKDFKEAMSIDPSNTQARVWYDEAVIRLSDPTLRTGSSGDDLSEILLPSFNGTSIDDPSVSNSDSVNNRDTLASRFMH